MRSILLVVTLICCQSLLAQRECASTQYVQEQRLIQPGLGDQMVAIENHISKNSTSTARSSRITATTIVKIPVVVHVLYHSASHNVTDEQVKSQIEALNRDFRRRNSDSSNTPASFRTAAADVMIEFYLATADPSGRPTNGIVRTESDVTEWRMDDKIKFSELGGDDAWDSRYYLNIWVGPMRSLLGYSSAPGCVPTRDGIVISTNAFGTISRTGPYNLGRTLVHEVGHWLGLKHIWGDSFCGDDMVDDTPKQGGFTTGCPSGYRSSCSNGESGDMFMNYMDFTDDACMNLFTYGQKNRMRSLFSDGGPRETLLSSKGLHAPWVAPLVLESPASSSFSIFPNPAQNFIRVLLNGDHTATSSIEIISITGASVKKEKLSGSTTSVSLNGIAAGIYYVQVKNGGNIYRQKFVRL